MNKKHRCIKTAIQHIEPEQVQRIAEFLKNQPKWHLPTKEEIAPGRGWRTKNGVKQHWLWRAKNTAQSWDDFNTWPDTITDRKHLIMPGELFLCDLVGGELWIGRMPNGREEKCEKIARVTDDMNRDYGNCFNGYAVLPELPKPEEG